MGGRAGVAATLGDPRTGRSRLSRGGGPGMRRISSLLAAAVLCFVPVCHCLPIRRHTRNPPPMVRTRPCLLRILPTRKPIRITLPAALLLYLTAPHPRPETTESPDHPVSDRTRTQRRGEPAANAAFCRNTVHRAKTHTDLHSAGCKRQSGRLSAVHLHGV